MVIEDKKDEKKEDVQTKKEITFTDNYLNASDDFIEESGSVFNLSFGKVNQDVDQKDDEIEDIVLPAADLLDYESITSAVYTLPPLDEISNVDNNESRSFSDWLHIMRYSNTSQPINVKEKKKSIDLIDNF